MAAVVKGGRSRGGEEVRIEETWERIGWRVNRRGSLEETLKGCRLFGIKWSQYQGSGRAEGGRD